MLELSVPALLYDLGAALSDWTLAYGTNGTRITQATAIRLLTEAQRQEFDSLRAEGVPGLAFKIEESLTVDAADSYRFPLSSRVRQVLNCFDDSETYHALGIWKTGHVGYVYEEGGRAIRFRNLTTHDGTVKAWVVLEPVRLCAGCLSSTATSTANLTLPASPSVGQFVDEDHYYRSARIAIVQGTGAGQVRKVSSYDRATRVCTVDTAWTTKPSAATGASPSHFSLMLDLPDVTKRSVVARAACMIADADGLARDLLPLLEARYQKAHHDAVVMLENQVVGMPVNAHMIYDVQGPADEDLS